MPYASKGSYDNLKLNTIASNMLPPPPNSNMNRNIVQLKL